MSVSSALLPAGQTGAAYLTLRRLIVWLAEPKIRMRGLAGIADAVEHLEGGALINAVDALAQHGDSLVQHFISRTLQQMCQPLFQMAREWVFDGRLNNAGTEFFVSSTGVVSALHFCNKGIHTYLGTPCTVSLSNKLQLRLPLVRRMNTTEVHNKLDSQDCNHCLLAPSPDIAWNAWESQRRTRKMYKSIASYTIAFHACRFVR